MAPEDTIRIPQSKQMILMKNLQLLHQKIQFIDDILQTSAKSTTSTTTTR